MNFITGATADDKYIKLEPRTHVAVDTKIVSDNSVFREYCHQINQSAALARL